MNQPSRSSSPEAADPPALPQPPPRPAFGFLLGGTTLGMFFACLLMCVGATPPDLILIVLSICGAVTGGFLETLWPKKWTRPAQPPKTKIPKDQADHECGRCGEVFSPDPIICPMCGETEMTRRTR